MTDTIEDERFAHISRDPRFKRLPKKERKLKIDKRFKSMFDDDSFKLKYSVDKRGRPIQLTSQENLKKYYDLSDSDEEYEKDVESDDRKHAIDENNSKEKNEISAAEEKGIKSKKQNKRSEVDELIKSDDSSYFSSDGDCALYSDIRGEGIAATSSSEEEDSSDSEDINEQFDHCWAELDADAERKDDLSTHRLSLCNMNWDRIKAEDILVLFSSFKPPGGIIRSVKIYLSDIGRKRLKEEELHGPKELTENTNCDYSDEQLRDGSEYHMERLRKYELSRLKYYYAIIDCNSAETADKIYGELDGMEYEESGIRLDLRFVPDDMTFEHEPTSIADILPEAGSYAPSLFTTKALQFSKVELTWDETNPDRTKAMQKAFDNEAAEKDVKAYVASASSDDESGEEESERKLSIAKYRDLILNIEKKEKERKPKDSDFEMEMSWQPGLETSTQKEIDKESKNTSLTPWEKYLEKKKANKANKKKDSLISENLPSEDQPFSDDEIPSDVDFDDPYFREEFEKSSSSDHKKKKKVKSVAAKNSDNEENDKSKAELELLMMDETAEVKHFNMKNIIEKESKSKSKKKRKRKAQEKPADTDSFKINVGDPRFEALYTSHEFNIDPSDQHFKRTKAVDDLIEEKQRRRRIVEANRFEEKLSQSSDFSKNNNLSALVKSVKTKTNRFMRKKKK